MVLDTNVVSELMRPSPDEAVIGWPSSRPAAALTTTSITVAEVRYGLARLPPGRRRDLLLAAADDVFALFESNVLPFDAAAARDYAEVVSSRGRTGAPISAFDAQIAAICRTCSAGLVTRNTGDFTGLGLDLHDPWGTGS